MTDSNHEGLLSLRSVDLAAHLLGARVSSHIDGQLVIVRVTEVEAYDGSSDPGSHAYRGRTARNSGLFGAPGTAYVYFTYGMHFCLNVVCGAEGAASAVLLRAGEVISGREAVLERRRHPRTAESKLLSGPARLAQGLGLTLANNLSTFREGTAQPPGPSLGLEGLAEDPLDHQRGPRTGVSGRGGSDEFPWRFWLPGEPSVSTYRKAALRKPRVRTD